MYSLYIALSFCSTHPQSLIHLSFSHLETSAQEGVLQRHLIFLKDQLPNLHKELLLGGRGVVEGNSCFALLASSSFPPTGGGFELLPTGGGWKPTLPPCSSPQLLSLPSASCMWLMHSHMCTAQLQLSFLWEHTHTRINFVNTCIHVFDTS